jgi:hypothetical protein
MTRINAFRSMKETDSVARGKHDLSKNAGALVFAAVLIVCSVTVGCSSDQPKPVSSNNQIPVAQSPVPAPSTMLARNKQSDPKPAPKKVVHKKPATVNYTDKTYGVTFEYPRRYAIETGNAATDLLGSSPVPMNFVQPGGVALAAVELPETNYVNTDFSSAFFNVSVHKTLTADQCNEFAVPQPKTIEAKLVEMKPTDAKPEDEKPVDSKPVEAKIVEETKSEPAPTPTQPASTTAPAVEIAKASDAQPTQSATTQPASSTSSMQLEPQGSKLLLGDMELRATEAVSGEGTRQSDSKYFHIYQNGACYEFGMNVTTVASAGGLTKHVDRDKVFNRLEQILSTVKINPVTPEVTAEVPTPTPAETPAQ